ncbi:mCG147573 [Mus musculus]|nr:mCG147573 [Mus musculus]
MALHSQECILKKSSFSFLLVASLGKWKSLWNYLLSHFRLLVSKMMLLGTHFSRCSHFTGSAGIRDYSSRNRGEKAKAHSL